MTQLYLGTGGFSNDDWVGIFYEPHLKKTQWLEFYSHHFNAVEINSTFYAVPGQKTFVSMLERSGGRLMFCAKLHRSFAFRQQCRRGGSQARFGPPLRSAEAGGRV